ncbi:MAG: DegT/DnrJ/EryC1/StrS family aminotransferase, partial [Patescibacteria group bacterium]|nr:DegT/DnrJ/EryC1/StrS family aminotransferase [Patescibacteria group bacterium]
MRLLGEVVKSDWLTTGTRVKQFEEGMKKLLGIQDGVLAVSSGTAALHLGYLSLGLKKGDEVIVPSFTFASTVNMIIHAGGVPIFCDIDEKTLCLDPTDVSRKITNRTRAVVAVHFGGMPADLDKLSNICKRRNIPVIEDAAHAILTKYKGKYVGTHGNTACFSFYATKAITTAEGGMIVMPNAKKMDATRLLALHGISKNAWSRYKLSNALTYEVVVPGYKYNLSDIHAAIGLSQLPFAHKDLRIRTRIASRYRKILGDVEGITLPTDPPFQDSRHAWHLFTIRTKDKKTRNSLANYLREHGIHTSVHFPPNHLQP